MPPEDNPADDIQPTEHEWDAYEKAREVVDCPNCGEQPEGQYAGPCPEHLHCDDDGPEPDTCPHCGKEYEDFSDLGCERCDQRHPGYGVIP